MISRKKNVSDTLNFGRIFSYISFDFMLAEVHIKSHHVYHVHIKGMNILACLHN